MKSILFAFCFFIPFIISAQLTGYWETDVGGCYQIRQNGNEIWWAGEGPDDQRPTNVFHGYLSGNNLTGIWCDLPSNSVQGCDESISLRLEGLSRLVKISSSASYNGSVWTRRSTPCEEGCMESAGKFLGRWDCKAVCKTGTSTIPVTFSVHNEDGTIQGTFDGPHPHTGSFSGECNGSIIKFTRNAPGQTQQWTGELTIISPGRYSITGTLTSSIPGHGVCEFVMTKN